MSPDWSAASFKRYLFRRGGELRNLPAAEDPIANGNMNPKMIGCEDVIWPITFLPCTFIAYSDD
jgi:hypothetical protein